MILNNDRNNRMISNRKKSNNQMISSQLVSFGLIENANNTE